MVLEFFKETQSKFRKNSVVVLVCFAHKSTTSAVRQTNGHDPATKLTKLTPLRSRQLSSQLWMLGT